MFIRNINGFLLNVSLISKINIQISETFCMVVAHLRDGTTETIYKSIELENAQDYLETLSRKIAVNYEIWEI
jgi:hypothetical protein